MDNIAVGNHMADTMVLTCHPCTRCITAFANGDYRTVGYIGCCFPEVDEDHERLYKNWVSKGDGGEPEYFRRCFRCFIFNQPCCAPPEAFEEDLKAVYNILHRLRVGKKKVVDKPATEAARMEYNRLVAAANGDKSGIELPQTVFDYIYLSDDDRRLARLELSDMCRPLAKQLQTAYAPAQSHLMLHNGAITLGESPQSEVAPNLRKRGNMHVAASHEAKKRTYEAAVASLVQDADEDGGTPKKKYGAGRVKAPAVSSKMQEVAAIEFEISDLESKRVGLKGKERSVVTKRITGLEKKKAALLAEESAALGGHGSV